MSDLNDLLKQLSEQSSALLAAVTSDVSSSEKDTKAQAFVQSSSETFKAVKSLTGRLPLPRLFIPPAPDL